MQGKKDNNITTNLLDSIQFPSDLKKLKPEQLVQVCDELRNHIIDVVSTNPGHFGASLGVVELTVALHYVYNTPYDKLIWDVGHQAYGHKMLTGRRGQFHTNRKLNGISGFPKIKESIYDAFGVGHASTSISAALGMAVASQLKGETDRKVVAVIGDGALTGGMAFEALNNAGIMKSDVLVILNDNNMAIDPNVGALSEYLVEFTASKPYNKFRDDVWNSLGKLNKLGTKTRNLARKIEGSLKSLVMNEGNLFEALNFRYFGPVDGHNPQNLVKVLNELRKLPGPKILHVHTIKGKGFKLAEENQTLWHAPGKFDKDTGEIFKVKHDNPQPLRYQDVFGYTIVELAELNNKIVGITPAMPSGCSLNIMMEKMPSRAFDVGIAEQHAVTFAAGLATEGMIPFCNIYSSFMQRAYDQVIHDVALQQLPVIMCLDRGGIVGEDGPTHHGVFDIAYMRCIPNLTIASPMNESELRNLMYTAQMGKAGAFVIRYPRGQGVLTNWQTPFNEIEIGKGRMISDGNNIAILSIGHQGNTVQKCIEMMPVIMEKPAHFDMRFIKPLDHELLHTIFKRFNKIITVEDGVVTGGFGTAVLEFMNQHNYKAQVTILGVPDKFVEHGTPTELIHDCGYSADGIFEAICNFVEHTVEA